MGRIESQQPAGLRGNWRVEAFLRQFRIGVQAEERQRWVELDEAIATPGVSTYVLSLSHVDYAEGPVMAQLVGQTKQTYAVLKSGFNGGMGNIRNMVTRPMFKTKMLTRNGGGTNRGELESIQQTAKTEDEVVCLFAVGNRAGVTHLEPGITMLMSEEGAVVFPMVVMSDQEPIFASKESPRDNLTSILRRGMVSRKKSTSYALCLPPLAMKDVNLMKEGKKGRAARARIMTKLEIIKQVTLGELFGKHGDLTRVEINQRMWDKLMEAETSEHHPEAVRELWSESLRWLVDNGYVDADREGLKIGEGWINRKILVKGELA